MNKDNMEIWVFLLIISISVFCFSYPKTVVDKKFDEVNQKIAELKDQIETSQKNKDQRN